MKHRGYKFLTEQLAGIARKAGLVDLPKKQRNTAGLLKAVGAIFEASPHLRATLDCLICAEECYFLAHGKRVYFLEDAEIARSIQRGAYNITSADALYQGAESFVLMIPNGLTFAGRQGSGVLVTIFSHVERKDRVFNDFFDSIGQPRAEVKTRGDLGDFTVCVSYQQGLLSAEYCRMAMPSHSIEHCMAFDSHEQYAAYQQEHNKFDFIGGIDLDLAESQYQWDLIRLVCGFLIYRVALPDRIIEGLPGFNPKDATTQYVKQVDAVHVHHPKGAHRSPEGHYRTWFFRQLVHERYYQGEHAHKPRGSRMVFVQDSFIGDVDAATAVK